MPATLRSLARTAAPGFLFFLAACHRAPVATVNGQPITAAELDAQLRVYQSVQAAAPDDPATRRLVLDQMVKQALLVQAARRAGLDRDPALRAEVDARRGALRQQLKRRILDAQDQLATLDEAVEDKVLIDAYSRSQSPGVTVTAQDLREAYNLRAKTRPLPPFKDVRDQLLEQLVLERLVERERPHAVIGFPAGQP